MTEISALAAMGLSLEELELGAAPKIDSTDRRICVCGHPMPRHKPVRGQLLCKPSRMKCKCVRPRAVIEVSDTRYFLKTTEGSGRFHALSRGIRGLTSKDITEAKRRPLETKKEIRKMSDDEKKRANEREINRVTLKKSPGTYKWIIEMKCDRCGNTTDTLIPSAVSPRGVSVDVQTGFDVLLCAACSREV